MKRILLVIGLGWMALAGATIAEAHDGYGRGWQHRHHHDHWRGRVFVGPPVAYLPGPRYLAPPPVMYAPPPAAVYPAPIYFERPYLPRPGITISVPPVFIGF